MPGEVPGGQVTDISINRHDKRTTCQDKQRAYSEVVMSLTCPPGTLFPWHSRGILAVFFGNKEVEIENLGNF